MARPAALAGAARVPFPLRPGALRARLGAGRMARLGRLAPGRAVAGLRRGACRRLRGLGGIDRRRGLPRVLVGGGRALCRFARRQERGVSPVWLAAALSGLAAADGPEAPGEPVEMWGR